MIEKPSEEELRDLLKEGKTLYQISRKFNMMVKEVYKLEIEYGITLIYEIPRPTKEDLESMYHEEHLTQYQISREFDVTHVSVGRWLCKHQIPTRGGRGTLAIPMPSKEVLIYMYTYKRLNQGQIAKEINVHQQYVSTLLRDYKIPTRGSNGTLAVPRPIKDELLNCIAEGLNQHQIAENYKVGDTTIFNWCEYYGIPGMVNGYRCTTPEHQEWKFAVFDRDHRTCQMCGVTNTMMQAHHIVPYADHPEIGYELENGITLCEHCHKSIRYHEYEYIEQFAAITQAHLHDNQI